MQPWFFKHFFQQNEHYGLAPRPQVQCMTRKQAQDDWEHGESSVELLRTIDEAASFERAQDWEGASTAYERLIDSNPQHTHSLYRNAGVCVMQHRALLEKTVPAPADGQKRLYRALGLLNECVSLEPENPSHYIGRASVVRTMGGSKIGKNGASSGHCPTTDYDRALRKCAGDTSMVGMRIQALWGQAKYSAQYAEELAQDMRMGNATGAPPSSFWRKALDRLGILVEILTDQGEPELCVPLISKNGSSMHEPANELLELFELGEAAGAHARVSRDSPLKDSHAGEAVNSLDRSNDGELPDLFSVSVKLEQVYHLRSLVNFESEQFEDAVEDCSIALQRGLYAHRRCEGRSAAEELIGEELIREELIGGDSADDSKEQENRSMPKGRHSSFDLHGELLRLARNGSADSNAACNRACKGQHAKPMLQLLKTLIRRARANTKMVKCTAAVEDCNLAYEALCYILPVAVRTRSASLAQRVGGAVSGPAKTFSKRRDKDAEVDDKKKAKVEDEGYMLCLQSLYVTRGEARLRCQQAGGSAGNSAVMLRERANELKEAVIDFDRAIAVGGDRRQEIEAKVKEAREKQAQASYQELMRDCEEEEEKAVDTSSKKGNKNKKKKKKRKGSSREVQEEEMAEAGVDATVGVGDNVGNGGTDSEGAKEEVIASEGAKEAVMVSEGAKEAVIAELTMGGEGGTPVTSDTHGMEGKTHDKPLPAKQAWGDQGALGILGRSSVGDDEGGWMEVQKNGKISQKNGRTKIRIGKARENDDGRIGGAEDGTQSQDWTQNQDWTQDGTSLDAGEKCATALASTSVTAIRASSPSSSSRPTIVKPASDVSLDAYTVDAREVTTAAAANAIGLVTPKKVPPSPENVLSSPLANVVTRNAAQNVKSAFEKIKDSAALNPNAVAFQPYPDADPVVTIDAFVRSENSSVAKGEILRADRLVALVAPTPESERQRRFVC
jgi:hypothetical protein